MSPEAKATLDWLMLFCTALVFVGAFTAGFVIFDLILPKENK